MKLFFISGFLDKHPIYFIGLEPEKTASDMGNIFTLQGKYLYPHIYPSGDPRKLTFYMANYQLSWVREKYNISTQLLLDIFNSSIKVLEHSYWVEFLQMGQDVLIPLLTHSRASVREAARFFLFNIQSENDDLLVRTKFLLCSLNS